MTANNGTRKVTVVARAEPTFSISQKKIAYAKPVQKTPSINTAQQALAEGRAVGRFSSASGVRSALALNWLMVAIASGLAPLRKRFM